MNPSRRVPLIRQKPPNRQPLSKSTDIVFEKIFSHMLLQVLHISITFVLKLLSKLVLVGELWSTVNFSRSGPKRPLELYTGVEKSIVSGEGPARNLRLPLKKPSGMIQNLFDSNLTTSSTHPHLTSTKGLLRDAHLSYDLAASRKMLPHHLSSQDLHLTLYKACASLECAGLSG